MREKDENYFRVNGPSKNCLRCWGSAKILLTDNGELQTMGNDRQWKMTDNED